MQTLSCLGQPGLGFPILVLEYKQHQANPPHVCKRMCSGHSMCTTARGPRSRVSSILLLPCRSQVSNSGHLALWQVLLPADHLVSAFGILFWCSSRNFCLSHMLLCSVWGLRFSCFLLEGFRVSLPSFAQSPDAVSVGLDYLCILCFCTVIPLIKAFSSEAFPSPSEGRTIVPGLGSNPVVIDVFWFGHSGDRCRM